jgi:hypothetical protein
LKKTTKKHYKLKKNNMANLDDNISIINSDDCDYSTQRIMIPRYPTKWNSLFQINPTVKDVYNSLEIKPNEYDRAITRDEIKTGTPQERVAKSLLWAFIDIPPKESVIYEIPTIADWFISNSQTQLTCDKYINLYMETIRRFTGIGKSTASVLFYGFDIRCNGEKSIAITHYIEQAMKRFSELKPLAKYGYIEQQECIRSEANRLDTDIERLEYFLFKVGKGEITIN